MSCNFHTIIIQTFLYTKIQIFLFFLRQREFARAILKGIYPCLYACKFMCSCVRSTMCMFCKYLWNGNIEPTASTKEIFDVIDTTLTEFILSFCPFNVIILLLPRAAAAFVVSDFRGPRPMSMCIHLQAAPWRLKYWRIKAEVTISTFLYLQEFFTGADILSKRFRSLKIYE